MIHIDDINNKSIQHQHHHLVGCFRAWSSL
jgi:hypothetical protein